MVNRVGQDGAPQNLSNGHLADEERELAIEIFRLQLANARHGFPVHSLISGCEALDRSWTLDIGRFGVHREPTRIDAVTHVRVTFGKMPGELAERAAAGVGPKVGTG